MVTTMLAKDQFIIIDGDDIIFKSYNTVIAKKSNNKIYLDKKFWKYSQTTSKYRSIFLEETTAETEKKIENGSYVLTNLN
jgi:hypothetical protein